LLNKQVTLRDEECEVCRSIGKAENIESRPICMSTESRKCSNDVEGKWIKLCRKIDDRKPMVIQTREPRNEYEEASVIEKSFNALYGYFHIRICLI
jgi:hypothetical protein